MRPYPSAIPAHSSVIVEFDVPIPAVAAGGRRFVVAIADIDVAGLRLDLAAADLASIDTVHAFCAAHPNAAAREFTAS